MNNKKNPQTKVVSINKFKHSFCLCRSYFLSKYSEAESPKESLQRAAAGTVTCLQLRVLIQSSTETGGLSCPEVPGSW